MFWFSSVARTWGIGKGVPSHGEVVCGRDYVPSSEKFRIFVWKWRVWCILALFWV